MKKVNFQKGKAEKLLQDPKSGFYKFIQKNNEIKSIQRDYIEGEIEELYVFFQSGIDPQWEARKERVKWE